MILNKKVSFIAVVSLMVILAISYLIIKSFDDKYKLPPEPNVRLNDSTLLGIDTNNNNVRDDVERWIYQTYDKYIPCNERDINIASSSGEFYTTTIKECNGEYVNYHPIIHEIAMQYARAYQTILKNPNDIEKNIELEDAAYYCNRYFTSDAKEIKTPILIDPAIASKLKAVQFNTQNRIRTYELYTEQLRGTVYDFEQGSYRKYCDFDIDTLLASGN
ncbi:MAG: hypothetical protein LBS26_03650 [Campylobacteraceae bacterium]|jgi:hypothetical protein|nr:hypothetical protein [Campylobacteraceae bacterium]